MSFFAVLNTTSRELGRVFEVPRLHLNFWSLAALGSRRRMFAFDVGVELLATGENSVTDFSLALPFDTLAPKSLFEKVRNPTTAELIFDSRVNYRDEGALHVGDQDDFFPAQLLIREAKKDKNYSDRGFTLWHLSLLKPLQPGERAYVRIRFPVMRTGRSWQWTKTRLRRTGAVFDLRIADIRSSAQVAGGAELVDQIVGIGKAAVFLMTPLWLHARSVNPDPKYIRLLEGRVWADYLDRAPELSRRSRLVVRYWKSKGEGVPAASQISSKSVTAKGGSKSNHSVRRNSLHSVKSDPDTTTNLPTMAITTENPMRVFAEFKVDSRRSRLFPAVIGGIIVFAIALGVTDLRLLEPVASWIDQLLAIGTGILEWIGKEVVKIGLTTLSLTVIGLVISASPYGKVVLVWLRDKFHGFEDRLFHMLRDIGPRD